MDKKQEICKELKSKLTQFSKRDIRRARIPLFQALKHELDENGFDKYCDFWIEILDKYPKLRNSKSFQLTLYSGFCKANGFSNEHNVNSEIIEMLILAQHFETLGNFSY